MMTHVINVSRAMNGLFLGQNYFILWRNIIQQQFYDK